MKKLIILFLFIFDILYCEDCGWEWQNQQPQGNFLTSVSYATEYIVYTCGDNGTILKTTDGGDNCVLLKTGVYIDFCHIFVINSNICLAVGLSKTLLHTTDGGESRVEENRLLVGTSEIIFFINENIGWLVGYDDIDDNGVILKYSCTETSVEEPSSISENNDFQLFQIPLPMKLLFPFQKNKI